MTAIISVMHSGTRFMFDVLGVPWMEYEYFYHAHKPQALDLAKSAETLVIPLRHPAMIAVSHKKRNAQRKGIDWLAQWKALDQFDGCFFKVESTSFEFLEDYLNREVNRIDRPVGSLGEYPEKQSLEAAREYLGETEWARVEEALATDVGKRFYQ